MKEVPITAVYIVDPKLHIVVVPGHHGQQEAERLARQQEPISKDEMLVSWTATMNLDNPAHTAARLVETARGIWAALYK